METRYTAKIAAIVLAIGILLAGCATKTAAPKMTPEEATKARDQAIDLITSHKVDDAVKSLQDVTKATPKDAKAQFLLGLALFNKGQANDAIAAYKKAIELDPKMVEAYNNIGNVYRTSLKQPADAITWYQKAIQVNPLFAYPYTNLSELYQDQGKQADAIAIVQQGITANPNNLDMRIYLAGLYQTGGDKQKAIATLEDLLKVSPNYGPAQSMLDQLKK